MMHHDMFRCESSVMALSQLCVLLRKAAFHSAELSLTRMVIMTLLYIITIHIRIMYIIVHYTYIIRDNIVHY